MHDPTLAVRIGAFSTWCCDLKDLYHWQYEHPLTEEEVEEYKALTYFNGPDIYQAFDLFSFHSRNLEITPRTCLCVKNDAMFRRMRSFYVCPFKERLMRLFSFDREYMSFTDWMDLYNSYHKRTPLEYKVEVAFRVFDLDDDGFISIDDIIEYLKRSTDSVLEEYDYYDVAELIVRYYDKDEDGMIGLSDFKLGIIEKDLDFGDKFSLSIVLSRDLRAF